MKMFSDSPHIRPYEYRGLRGRYAFVPAVSSGAKRVFLIVYGQHASLERCMPLVHALSQFGDVYIVDTPGFGGMDAAYRIDEKPTLKFYSGHMQNIFDTLLPQDRKVTLFGISYGLQLITYFTGHNPAYHKRIEEVVSFVGLVSYKNMRISKPLEFILKQVTRSGKKYLGSKFYEHIVFKDVFLRPFYLTTAKRNPKFNGLTKKELNFHAKEQAWLWRINDRRTHAQTAADFLFKTDLTNFRINLPIIHIGVPHDHLLDNDQVVKDLEKIYKSVDPFELDLPGHAPVSLDDGNKILALFPERLTKILKTSDNN